MLYIFSIGLILLPLIYWPAAAVPYEIPRVWFLQRWIEVLLILGLWRSLTSPIPQKINVKFILLILGFFLIAVISSIFGVDAIKSFWGNFYRGDGLLTLFHLVGLSVLLIIFWQDNWKKHTAYSISFGAFITSFWAVISGIRLIAFGDITSPHWIDGAIGVSFGQPKFLAGYLLVSLPFTICLFKTAKVTWKRVFYLISIIVQTLAITFTRSWGGLLGVGLLIILIIFLCTKFKKQIVILLTAIFIILTLIIVEKRLHQENGFVAEGRERIFRKVIMGSMERPVLGWGWANVDYAFESVDWPIRLQHDVYVDKAHSTFLEILATMGIFGLIYYLIFLAKIGNILIKQLKRKIKTGDYLWSEALLLVFILYLFHAQTNVISINEEVFFWMIIGIAGSNRIDLT